jgi:hypothetical protein
MNAIRIWRLLPALVGAGALWALATPAQAQLAAGCACPAGFVSASSITCIHLATKVTVPAICPARNIGQIAAAQQQQSFWGINTILQQKRDQLQNTPIPGAASSRISGFASSNFEGDTLGYADKPQKSNPLASPLYDAAPSAAPANPVWGTWVQGLADSEHDNALATTDVGHINNTYTAQAGVDRTQQAVLSSDDALVLGMVSSWTSSHVSYENSPTTMNLMGPGIGVYTAYVKGGFSTDVTAKFDFLQMSLDFAGSAPNTSIGITNAGLNGNVQYKFTGPNNGFFEPTMGFSLTHTGFGSAAAALNLEDAYTVRLQAGARLGTTWQGNDGTSVDANLKVLAYGNAIAQGTSVAGAATFAGLPATPLTSPLSPSDGGLVRAELDPVLCFNLADNYSVTLSGQLRMGRDLMGESAGINIRKQW